MMMQKNPIAVVGIAGVLPEAPDIDVFWNNIINKIDASREIPEDRWPVAFEDIYSAHPCPDKAVSKRACLINNNILQSIKSNHSDFNIDKDLLKDLDPLYHLVLHAGSKAFSSFVSSPVNKERIGIILAAIALPTDASSLITREITGKSFEEKLFNNIQVTPLNKNQCISARVTALPSAILARALGIGGISYTLDAACASSLYAVKLACDELCAHRADAMLAGGVSRPESMYTQIGFSQLRALSPSGRCAPFDESADGLVVGEGIGIIVLKRLEDALRDRDMIYGLIRGIGLSNDIKGNLLAPDSEGQVRAMQNAYKSAGWSPYDIDLIECHGAGTRVGDATEINSLKTMWKGNSRPDGKCRIGSVKSMTGHLLTAAGAAGMLKTLLAIKHKTLPPSLNFNKPQKDSGLNNSPFKVQTQPEEWKRKTTDSPLRAAVSAFGFGGINAHLLFEEWRSSPDSKPKTQSSKLKTPSPPVAIVGMEAAFGSIESLKDFEETIFNGRSVIRKRPEKRWKGSENIAEIHLKTQLPFGGYMDRLIIDAGEFHIPPNEIPDILLQQLLMLKVSARAMNDAGLELRKIRPRMGVLIGIGFDFEATSFNVRWHLNNYVKNWAKKLGLDSRQTANWLKSLKDSCGPPLTSTRTLGALGGIVASRIAREFRLGGPSFVVSDEETSGLKALEIGVRSLQQNETDAFLVGAIDLCGDVRNIIMANKSRPFTKKDKICPFDKSACGTLPGEGAAALVLKRLDTAIKDKNRIYSVIKGIGNACGGEIPGVSSLKKAYILSLKRSFDDAGVKKSSTGYIETHGSGNLEEDNIESEAFNEFFTDLDQPCAAGAVKPNIGHTGATSGIASLVKASLCLHKKIIPPLINCVSPANNVWKKGLLSIPASSQSWPESGENCPRSACIASMTIDGNCSHVILEEFKDTEEKPDEQICEYRNQKNKKKTGREISLIIGGEPPCPALPSVYQAQQKEPQATSATKKSVIPYLDFIEAAEKNFKSTADAHKTFLDFSAGLQNSYAKTFELQTELLTAQNINGKDERKGVRGQGPGARDRKSEIGNRKEKKTPLFSREMCMEFATGSLAKVLGPEFAVVDTYNARVRLPDEPLMLVDRIVSVKGEKASLGSGCLVTEHDVLPEAWYLDGGRVPVCISIEAGQADLFLCSYLGIDLVVKGKRTYRLLDAVVTFHSGLPQPGDTIKYEINIEKFIRQGETYLFFFDFKGFINDCHIITMSEGCAGFFTKKEVEDSGGISLSNEDKMPVKGKKGPGYKRLVETGVEKYNDEKVNALRDGNLKKCFGPVFNGVELAESLRLPGKQKNKKTRMKLIDRILHLDPDGGKYGLGIIKAEADIHPDDWFLTCHFMDDMVMPGTLMYECCAHTLRVFIQRIGWVTNKSGVYYEPVVGVKSRLKCRGPVTLNTKHVVYEIIIKEIRYSPEPYVIADALMYADDHRIVMFTDMSMKMTGITGGEIESFWKTKKRPALFDQKKLLAFSIGKPSDAFGEPYKEFDEKRRIARLPGPPYFFIDRIVSIEPKPWVLKPDGWIEAEYDVPYDAWYFKSDRSNMIPFCVLLEIALQPCGWLAAYMGSALKSKNDLKFRNLGGNAVICDNVSCKTKTLTMKARTKKVSEAGEMIIEEFDFLILNQNKTVYEGNTSFGFFTETALMKQKGLGNTGEHSYSTKQSGLNKNSKYLFQDDAPLTPEDSETDTCSKLSMPSKALRMIDEIDLYLPDGGPEGLGFIRGTKNVNPDEWFFKAHFYQDPVWPGSLGIEAFLQLIKFVALDRWKHLSDTHKFELITQKQHNWTYRGQVIPSNKKIEVEAVITSIQDVPFPGITADGFLKVDGLYIYEMKNFGFSLISDEI